MRLFKLNIKSLQNKPYYALIYMYLKDINNKKVRFI